MKIHILLLGFACVANLGGQHRFRWQDACFKNPAAPFCQGHEDAIKRPAPAKAPASPIAVTNPSFSASGSASRTASRPRTPAAATPTLIVVGGIDWRFADPLADALAGFNFNGLSASPLARNLVAQLAAKNGRTDADVKKIFDGLAGVDQVALSLRADRVVVMITGRVADSTLPAPEAGLKAVPVSGNAILLGHADAVDQAVQRIAMKGPLSESTRLAEGWQASSDFWALGAARLIGQQAVSAGVKRFSMTVSIRDRLTSDMALEFYGAPSPNTLQTWETTLGGVALEGNVVHARTSMEAGEAQQKFGQIAAGPLGEPLAALVDAARYLPVRDTTIPRQTKPVIYGLDGGPRVVNQDAIK